MAVKISNRNRETARIAATVCIGLLLVILCPLAAQAAAGYSEAVALVMDIKGATTPPLSIYREIAPGTRIELGPGARVSLLHYTSCTIVTLVGGAATVSDEGITANVANIESTRPGPCPRVHKIAHKGPGPLGGVIVTRGDPMPPMDVAPDALIILSGAGFKDALSADVLDNNHNPVGNAISVRGQSFKLDNALAVKRAYLLRISFAGRSDTVELPFSISGRGSGGLLVLRLD